MYVALREGDGNTILIQRIVNQLLGSVNVANAFGHQHLLLHSNGDRAVVHLLQGDADAALRIHDVAPKGILVL